MAEVSLLPDNEHIGGFVAQATWDSGLRKSRKVIRHGFQARGVDPLAAMMHVAKALATELEKQIKEGKNA